MMSEKLKALVQNVNSSKLSVRRVVFEDAISAIQQDKALPEPAVKALCRHLAPCLILYENGKSRQLFFNLLVTISTVNPECTVRNLPATYEKLISAMRAREPNGGVSRATVMGVISICRVLSALSSDFSLTLDEVRPLIQCLCELCTGCFTTEKSSLRRSVYRSLRRLWKKKPTCLDAVCQYLSTCDSRPTNLAAISFVCQFLRESQQLEQRIPSLREKFVKHFIDSVLIVKGKQSSVFLECSHELLKACVNHESFSEHLLPAFEKALLRSPETCMQAVGTCLAHIDVELSSYVSRLLPVLATHLKSADEGVSNMSADAVVALGQQCSDPEPVKEIVKRLQKILTGSEGKLGLPESRQRVAATLGRLSTNGLVGKEAVQPVFDLVTTEAFLQYIKVETHESSIVWALAQLEKWTKRNKQQMPEKLVTFFKANAFVPKLSSTVRIAYLQCLQSSCSRTEALQQIVSFVPCLMEIIQRAIKQAAQTALVTEAVFASAILLRLLPLLPAGDKHEQLWGFLLNKENKYLFNRKFLSSATDAVFHPLLTVVERTMAEFTDKLNDTTQSLMLRTILLALSHRQFSVRSAAQAHVRQLLHGLRGVEFSLLLLADFEDFVTTRGVADAPPASQDAGDGHLLAATLLSITGLQANNEALADRIAVALRALGPATHSAIVAHQANVWPTVIRRLGLQHSAKAVIESDLESLVQRFLSLDRIDENIENSVLALCTLSPQLFIPAMQNGVVTLLQAPEFSEVTAEEVGIMRTPEGELFDKSIIQTTRYEEQTYNFRREDKNYSYREQMEEYELRKEIEAKKRARGEWKETAPKLTKKQEELLVAQRERETAIRRRMLPLDGRLTVLSRLLTTLGRGDPQALRAHLPDVVPVLVSLLPSPLAAPHAARCLEQLSRVAFIPVPRHRHVLCPLASLAPHALCRLAEAACDLDPAWTAEDAEQQATRLVALILAWQRGRAAWTRAVEDGGNLSFALLFPSLRLLLPDAAAVSAVCHQVERSGDGDCSTAYLPQDLLFGALVRVEGAARGAAHAGMLELARRVNDEGCVDPVAVKELSAFLNNSKAAVRTVVLKCLVLLADNISDVLDADDDVRLQLRRRIFMTRFDEDEVNARTAGELWEKLDLSHGEDLIPLALKDLGHEQEERRAAVAKAVSELVQLYPDSLPETLSSLFEKYSEKSKLPPPVVDNFGRVVSTGPMDQWQWRSGVALALGRLSERLPQAEVYSVFQFLVPDALNDRDERVRQQMLDTAMGVVEAYGQENLSLLLPLLEDFLSSAPNIPELDAGRQSVIVLIGSLAKHLEKNSPKVKAIFVRLLESLSFPSQAVQQAVANCLPPLMPSLRDEAPTVVEKLLQLLLESEDYGERRGAAYGLAGVVKGLGILVLKQLNITERLSDAVKDKKNPRHREGALFAFESLCLTLGRVYEPYIVNILRHLLLAFGDSSAHVREAANDCAKAVMSKLSAHGVKMVLPSLLNAIEEDSWRTKCGSVELLGAMAFCAPKQLSACLPQIVPKLTEVLADSHPRVQNAGCQALKQIGSVIRNPEIQDVVPILMEALQDPLTKTTSCLQTLLNTQFVHVIDAPSLALIMPVVQRGFKDRSTETRKMASQIIGNMYSLTDNKDLQPYLDGMLPGLQVCLLDPVPEVRAMAARALGAMVRGMGESSFNEMLMPWLMKTLTSESSSVDRSGAAQGLAEVMGGLGVKKLESMMPHVMEMTENTQLQAHVRDGYLMMYIYLPGVYGDGFSAFVGPLLPSILKALADETEFVRETALRAGQRIVQMFAEKAIELLLPELERGMLHENWRIRHSSVQLLGDLLFKISGVSGKGTTEGVDEEDTFGTEASQSSLQTTLGLARRDRVLAGLYMARSDAEYAVRQAAVHVWKVIVANTPRTLREILPALFPLLLLCLASEESGRRRAATGTLGDVVRKLGDRVLPEILPILESGLRADDAVHRVGVCLGLGEIVKNASREQTALHADILLPPLRRALADDFGEVRAAAATTFELVFVKMGRRALDEVLPSLLDLLDEPEKEERALDGLRQLVAVKSEVVLPYLIPKLTTPTVNTRAFSFLAAVAGESLSSHLSAILPALLNAVSTVMGTDKEEEELDHCTQVILSVADEAGLRTILDEFTGSSLANRSLDGQIASMLLMEAFVRRGQLDLSDQFATLLRAGLSVFVSSDPRLLNAAWDCVNAIVQKWSPEESLRYVIDLRQSVQMAVREYKEVEVPGFGLPKKGITPFIGVYREGIFNGQLDVKEAAARGLGEIVSRTSKTALQLAVVKVAGPLIRVMGDRYSHSIKASILETLGILLEKCPTPMRPFLTQLQTTFIKALNDQVRDVRLRAAIALGHLMAINTKLDPVFSELVSLVRQGDEARETALFTLRLCLTKVGAKLSETTRRLVAETLRSIWADEDDGIRLGVAAGLGALCGSSPDADPGINQLVLTLPAQASVAAWIGQLSRLQAILVALRVAGESFTNPAASSDSQALQRIVEEGCDSDRLPVKLVAMRCLAYILINQIRLQLGDAVRHSVSILMALMQNSQSIEVKHLCARIASFIAAECSAPGEVRLYAGDVLAVIIVGLKDRNQSVRAASEQGLVDVCDLHNKEEDDILQVCLKCLEGNARTTVSDTVTRMRKRPLPKDVPPVIDNTELK